MKKRSIFFISIVLTLFISGCKYDFLLPVPIAPVPAGVKFSTQVAPIFSNSDKCTSCHKPGGSKSSPDFTAANAFNSLMPMLVNTASPDQSKIITIPGPTSSTHAWKKLTAGETAIILQWITEGAKNN